MLWDRPHHKLPLGGPNMSYAIVGILVIAFIAFVILSAKAWHWSNIVFLCLCFLAGLGGLIGMAQVLDARWDAMRAVAKSEKDLKDLEQQLDSALYGTGSDFEYGEDSLRGLSEALNLELAGRGRVWKHGAVAADGANRTFSFAAERVLSEDNPNAMQDMLLYVFSDQVKDEETYPVNFVGSMRVVSETPGAVVLEPVFIADQEEYDSPSLTWSLFEKAPIDQRDAYIRDTDTKLDPEDSRLNEELTKYRQILVDDFIPAASFGFDLNDADQARQYEMMIDRIMFDGLPLVKIESWIETQADRVSQRFDPPNEEVFVRYRFDSKSNRPYQVDSDGNIDSDGQFTQNGQAVDPALHAGGEIEFQKGDEILIDQLTADGYQRGEDVVQAFSVTEPVTEIERVFVRQLSDFPFLLKTASRQVLEYSGEIARLDQNNARSQQAVEDTQNQSNERDTEIEKLLADQEKFDADVALIRRFAEQIRIRKGELETKVSELEEQIKSQHRKVKAIVRAILSVTEEATGTETAPPTLPVLAPGPYDSLSPAGELR